MASQVTLFRLPGSPKLGGPYQISDQQCTAHNCNINDHIHSQPKRNDEDDRVAIRISTTRQILLGLFPGVVRLRASAPDVSLSSSIRALYPDALRAAIVLAASCCSLAVLCFTLCHGLCVGRGPVARDWAGNGRICMVKTTAEHVSNVPVEEALGKHIGLNALFLCLNDAEERRGISVPEQFDFTLPCDHRTFQLPHLCPPKDPPRTTSVKGFAAQGYGYW